MTVHGGDGWRVAQRYGLDPSQVLDLSMSLNPCAPEVASVVVEQLAAIGRYPDDESATALLAAAIGIDAARMVLTNGGAEAIALVAAEVGAGAVVEPEFALYRRHLSVVDARAGRWRSNPSNPLGQLAAPDDVAAVWDEAFWPLATGSWTRGDDTSWRLGSLTKLWACPGLRLGYAIAPDAGAADRLRARRPQWSVGGLALAVVEPLLALTDLAGWSSSIARRRALLAAALGDLGYAVTSTDVNWLLVDGPADLHRRLAVRGVVVRDCTSFGLSGTFRVALPRPADDDRVLTAFAAACGGGPSGRPVVDPGRNL